MKKIKVLIITLRFWPEPFRIADIADALVEKGFDVTVLCGVPNLPQGRTYEEYKHKKNRIQEHNGMKIIRSTEIERRNNIVFRLLNYYSFPHFCKKTIKHLKEDFDVVLVNELSPIMACEPAVYYKKLHPQTKVVMYEMDPWPDSLLCGGIKKDSIIYNHYKKVSWKIYSSCDKILVSTKEHIEYIHNLPHCENIEIEYLPQYAETQFEEMQLEQKIDSKHINLLFAGNIGVGQSVETIIKAAKELKEDKRFQFHIVGAGSDLEHLKHMVSEYKLDNVIFYGSKPVEEMPHFYEMADVMLVTLENKEYAKLTVPGKVQSYMAAGRPIIGAISGSGNNFIKNNKIGFAAEAEDYLGLANIIKDLPNQDLLAIGKHARECYLTKYSKKKFIDKLSNELIKYSK